MILSKTKEVTTDVLKSDYNIMDRWKRKRLIRTKYDVTRNAFRYFTENINSYADEFSMFMFPERTRTTVQMFESDYEKISNMDVKLNVVSAFAVHIFLRDKLQHDFLKQNKIKELVI